MKYRGNLFIMSEIDASLPSLVHAVSRGLRRSWIQELEPHGITPHEWRALNIIIRSTRATDAVTDRGPLRQRDLAEALHIAPRSAAEVVRRLEELGLVSRSPHPEDKRAMLITATQAGRDVEAHVGELRDQAGTEYFASLSPQDAADLARILGKLTEEHPVPQHGRHGQGAAHTGQ